MLDTHIDAEKRYNILREAAIQATVETLRSGNNKDIKLSLINAKALNATQLWSKSKVRQVDWDWIEGYSSFKFRYPKRFEMALWDSRQLIGISMGRPTYQGSALRLDVVEASPSDLGERSSIFEAVLLGYGIYARLLNAKQIRIMNPINNTVKSYYETFGYEYVPKGDYLYKEIF